MENLEKEVQKIAKKQWIPLYGPIQAGIDFKKGKPTIFDTSIGTYFGSIIEQGLSISAVIYSLYVLLS